MLIKKGHWAIPQEEALHLCETVHSGLMVGAQKCSGEKAMCAHCLKNGKRTEETAAHVQMPQGQGRLAGGRCGLE